jgi:16S rRNA (guanine527-N7)-methyltransferase
MTTPVDKYFPDLAPLQRERFAALGGLYGEWNARINVISRRDMEHFYERHVLHSLAIARVCAFADGARVMDVGSGGGFPGVPLAIMFPEARFTLVDSIGKKVGVIRGVCEALGLENVTAVNARAEQVVGRFDYVVSRAVTDMATFAGWVWDKIEAGQRGSLSNGILYLKGGDLTAELAAAGRPYTLYDIADFFDEEFFATKKVVYLPKRRHSPGYDLR